MDNGTALEVLGEGKVLISCDFLGKVLISSNFTAPWRWIGIKGTAPWRWIGIKGTAPRILSMGAGKCRE